MSEKIKIDFEKTVKMSNFSEKELNTKKFHLNKFIESGFPNRKLENWKFIDLSKIIRENMEDLSFYNDQSITNSIDTSSLIDGLEHNKIIFINAHQGTTA